MLRFTISHITYFVVTVTSTPVFSFLKFECEVGILRFNNSQSNIVTILLLLLEKKPLSDL